MQNEKLWQAIQEHPFEPGFADRLAREEGWSDAFAAGAVEEYRRFLFLSQLSDTPVTPSVIIDKVWHLHMTDTRNYWDGFCAKVLGKPLHHDVGKSAADDLRHREQFRNTRALYATVFGESAPDTYWKGEERKDNPVRRVITLVVCVLIAGAAMTTGDRSIMALGLLAAVVVWAVFSGVPLAVSKKTSNSAAGCSGGGCGSDCGGGGCGGD
ncbi:hypothetical protein J3R80_11965 [Aliiroseovarius sp. Z3]|uniref:glycine-rich domain-containing protein n=1 Tax=Aliiroseovarius sp. Z3 TaxID=2811402 RepID=UPI0023B298E5|nr:hypothetical protein [Aliiroseovarius sp. Z3]MDE9451181.1 hypothetical protein [Aliiroseovarius sp. Z3]